MEVHQIIGMIVYTIALWLCFRIWYMDLFQKNDTQGNPYNSISTEQMQIAHLQKENSRLKISCEAQKAKIDEITAQWLQEIKMSNRQTACLMELKKQNEMLYETFNDEVYNYGMMVEELDSMVQLMKGKPASITRQQQAIQAVRKSEGTELYDLLTAGIAGAKERVQAALDAETESATGNTNDGNMDVMKYIYV